jgi:sulfoxide reductase catalytic subunit YedY
MLIRKPSDIRSSDITPETVYRRRRELLKGFAAAPLLLAGCGQPNEAESAAPATPVPAQAELAISKRGQFSTDEPQTTWQDATHYNNYYEFGTGKDDPANRSGRFEPAPWTGEIAGAAEVTVSFSLEGLLKCHPL